MKIVFVSNYFNHHQRYLSDELFILTNGEYHFIATSKMSEERKKIGYKNDNTPSYVILAYESEYAKEKSMELILSADVVIAGSAPEKMFTQRISNGNLVFRYSERPLKKGDNILKYFPRMIRWNQKNPKNKPIYMLCSSAYTSLDYTKYHVFKNKMFKWGYFPQFITYDNVENLIRQKDKNSIIWCGRFLDWKHPEMAVILAQRLKKLGYNFKLRIIGTGILSNRLKEMTSKYNLDNYIYFCGPMSPNEVRRYMEKSSIFIFTSDKQEGWGTVLNEAMNSACAVVASHLTGSAPYLIKHRNNGLIFQSENIDSLTESVSYLLDNPDEQIKYGLSAYETIYNEWNPKIAAERFVQLANNIISGQNKYLYVSGPCSKSDILKENWFKQ